MANAIEVARCQDYAYVRIGGLGNFNNAGAVREWVENEIHFGARTIVLDMSECYGLDSTFMGTIMGFLSCPLTVDGEMQRIASSSVSVTVLNATDGAKRAMLSLGLQACVNLRDGVVAVPNVPLRLLNTGDCNYQQRIRLIREAHENLVELDPANEKIFAPFLDMLLKDA